MTQSCATCRFFSPTVRTDFGHCRRRAPRVGRETGWHEMFPNVTGKDWCGEHEAGPSSPADAAADEEEKLPFDLEAVNSFHLRAGFTPPYETTLTVFLSFGSPAHRLQTQTYGGANAVRYGRALVAALTGTRLA